MSDVCRWISAGSHKAPDSHQRGLWRVSRHSARLAFFVCVWVVGGAGAVKPPTCRPVFRQANLGIPLSLLGTSSPAGGWAARTQSGEVKLRWQPRCRLTSHVEEPGQRLAESFLICPQKLIFHGGFGTQLERKLQLHRLIWSRLLEWSMSCYKAKQTLWFKH